MLLRRVLALRVQKRAPCKISSLGGGSSGDRSSACGVGLGKGSSGRPGAGPRGAVPRRAGAPGLGWTRVLRARGRVLGARGGDWGGGPWGAGPRAGSQLQGGSWRGRFLGARGGDWRRVLGVRVLWAARAGVLRSSRARPLKSPRRAASPARAAAVRPAPRPKSAGWDRGHGGGRRPQRLSGAPGAGRGRRRG